MPGQIRVSGTWKQVTPHLKVGGAWKQAREGWVKVNGVWRRWYVSATTFSFTGSQVTYTVPTGTTSITVDMAGAAGGGVSNTVNSGGGRNGGRIQATLPVTPGQVLYLRVGGAGKGASVQFPGDYQNIFFNHEGGWPGGGNSGHTQLYINSAKNAGASGGGYSGIFTGSTPSQANALVVAAGGGGLGQSPGSGSDPYVGKNATTSSGGAAGGAGQPNNDAQAGSALKGGNGDSNSLTEPYPGRGASGGGAGYFGGGGGWTSESTDIYGYGGNGSSWAHASATNVTTTNEFQAGNGYITIFA